MKTLKLWATCLCMMVVLMSNATTPTLVNSIEILPEANQKVFTLSAKTSGEGSLQIRIVDAAENVVFSKKVKAISVFEQRFNVKNFETGEYEIAIEDESKVITQSLTVGETTVTVNSDNYTFITKSQITMNESH